MSRVIQNKQIMINGKLCDLQICADQIIISNSETKDILVLEPFTEETIQTILKENQ